MNKLNLKNVFCVAGGQHLRFKTQDFIMEFGSVFLLTATVCVCELIHVLLSIQL